MHIIGIYTALSEKARRRSVLARIHLYLQTFRRLIGRQAPAREQSAHGQATVNFQLPGSNTLVLSAYRPTSWTVKVTEGGRLDKIIAVGYYNQTVRVVGSQTQVEVEQFGLTRWWGTVHPCGYTLPHTSGYCNTDELIADIENITGQDVASYDGCYAASKFVFKQTKPTVCSQSNDSESDQENQHATTLAGPTSLVNGTLSPGVKTSRCDRLVKRPVILDCATSSGYSVSSYRSNITMGTALHVVSIYESRSSWSHKRGRADVDFQLPGSNVLVISSYEPNDWYIKISEAASLDKIISFGYYEQRFFFPNVSPARKPVIRFYGYQNRSSNERVCGSGTLPTDLKRRYGYRDRCGFTRLKNAMKAITGLNMTSFHGCYRATKFDFKPQSASFCQHATAARQLATSPPVTTRAEIRPQTMPSALCYHLVKRPVILDCATLSGYRVRSYRLGTALHVVSIYESRSSWSHERGRADIDFQLPGSNILVISSYEPTDWYVKISEAASLDKIVSFGYHKQRFFFPNVSSARKPVIRLYGYQNRSSNEQVTVCGHSTLRRDLETTGCGLNRLNAAMEAITGLKVTTFHGCYRATKFQFKPQSAFCPYVATGTGSDQEDRQTTTLAVTSRLHTRTLPQSAKAEKCNRRLKSPVILDCATSSEYTVSSYRANITMGTALHVVSIYESLRRSFRSHPRGRVDIDFQLPGSNVLVISSYEPNDWYVKISEAASLDKIISFGYYEQRFFFPNVSPARKPVIRFYGYQNRSSNERVCGSGTLPTALKRRYGYRDRCGFTRLKNAMKAITGLNMASFHGCYRATKFDFKPQSASFCPHATTARQLATSPGPVTTQAEVRPQTMSVAPRPCNQQAKNPVIQVDCPTADHYVYRSDNTASETAVHVAAIYQSPTYVLGPGRQRVGRANVDFQLPGKNIILISAYDRTDWNITIGQGGSLQEVISFGYYRQFVRVVNVNKTIPNPVIRYYGLEENSTYASRVNARVCKGFHLPLDLDRDDCDFDSMLLAIEAIAGHKLTSYDSCYRATTFSFSPRSVKTCQPSPASATPRRPMPQRTTSPLNRTTPRRATQGCSRLAKEPVVLDCQRSPEANNFFRAHEVPEVALHVLSVYNTYPWTRNLQATVPPLVPGPPKPLRGIAEVDFALPGSNVLALSSVRPTNWSVHVRPGASLQKIVTFGIHDRQYVHTTGVLAQNIKVQHTSLHQVPPGTLLVEICGKRHVPLAFKLEPGLSPHERRCDLQTLSADLERVTGAKLASFDSCFSATKFTLKQNTAANCQREGSTLWPAKTPFTATQLHHSTTARPKTGRTTAQPTSWCGRLARQPVFDHEETCLFKSTYRAKNVSGTALHVIALASVGPKPPTESSSASVVFQLPGANVLLLSSDVTMNWTVTLTRRGSLSRIIAVSPYKPNVRVKPSSSEVPVQYRAFSNYPRDLLQLCPFTSAFRHRFGCSFDRVLADVQRSSGLKPASFDGCTAFNGGRNSVRFKLRPVTCS